jgi:hypothetical protein
VLGNLALEQDYPATRAVGYCREQHPETQKGDDEAARNTHRAKRNSKHFQDQAARQ